MRQGMTIDALTSEVSRQRMNRRDFVAPSSRIEMAQSPSGLDIILNGEGGSFEAFAVSDLAHQQIAEDCGIPMAFYRRTVEQFPGLTTKNVNTILHARHLNGKRLIRTLDGKARAFLTARYRCIDNLDLVERLLPELIGRSDLRLASCDLTDRKLYVKVISDAATGEVNGKPFRAGLIVSNSEVGLGSVLVAPFTEVEWCTNGATHVNYGKRTAHVHKGYEEGEADAEELFSDETRAAADNAFFLKIRDIVRGTLSGEVLSGLEAEFRRAAGEKIADPAPEVVETVGSRYGFNEGERVDVLRHLIEGADLSRWGLANAITRAAQDCPSYDRASDLEAIGGDLMLTPGGVPKVEKGSRRRGRRSAADVAASN